jgi:hypothetical protein
MRFKNLGWEIKRGEQKGKEIMGYWETSVYGVAIVNVFIIVSLLSQHLMALPLLLMTFSH